MDLQVLSQTLPQVSIEWLPVELISIIYDKGLDDGDLLCLLITSKTMLSHIYNTDFSSYLFKFNTRQLTKEETLQLFYLFARFDKMDFMCSTFSLTEEINIVPYFYNQRRYSIDKYYEEYFHDKRCYIYNSLIGLIEKIFGSAKPLFSIDKRNINTLKIDTIKYNKGIIQQTQRTMKYSKGIIQQTENKEIRTLIDKECNLIKCKVYLDYGLVPTIDNLVKLLKFGEDEDYVLQLCRKFQLPVSKILHLFKDKFDRYELRLDRYGLSIETFSHIIRNCDLYMLEDKIKLKGCLLNYMVQIFKRGSKYCNVCEKIHNSPIIYKISDRDKDYLFKRILYLAEKIPEVLTD